MSGIICKPGIIGAVLAVTNSYFQFSNNYRKCQLAETTGATSYWSYSVGNLITNDQDLSVNT